MKAHVWGVGTSMFAKQPELSTRELAWTAVMEALHDAARRLGATSMTLNVFGDNATAIRLYESSGYTVTAQQMRLGL